MTWHTFQRVVDYCEIILYNVKSFRGAMPGIAGRCRRTSTGMERRAYLQELVTGLRRERG